MGLCTSGVRNPSAADIRYRSRDLREVPLAWTTQDVDRDFPMLGLCVAAVFSRSLPECPNNGLIDIAHDQLGHDASSFGIPDAFNDSAVAPYGL